MIGNSTAQAIFEQVRLLLEVRLSAVLQTGQTRSSATEVGNLIVCILARALVSFKPDIVTEKQPARDWRRGGNVTNLSGIRLQHGPGGQMRVLAVADVAERLVNRDLQGYENEQRSFAMKCCVQICSPLWRQGRIDGTTCESTVSYPLYAGASAPRYFQETMIQ